MYFYANSGFHASLFFHKDASPWRQLQLKTRNFTLYVRRLLTTCLQAKREEVTRGWRKLHNPELHVCPPYRITMTKSRNVRFDELKKNTERR